VGENSLLAVAARCQKLSVFTTELRHILLVPIAKCLKESVKLTQFANLACVANLKIKDANIQALRIIEGKSHANMKLFQL